MATSKVSLDITAENKTEAGLAAAAADVKAFNTAVNTAMRKNIGVTDAYAQVTERAAEKTRLAAELHKVLADRVDGTSGAESRLSGIMRSVTGVFDKGVISLNGLMSSMNGLTVGAIPALIAGLAAFAAPLTVLLANLALVGAGFVGFAAIAVPEIMKVWTAVSKGGAALKKLTPQERELVGPIRSLKDEFHKLAKAVQPEILKAFGEALKILKDLMPAIKPLVVAAGKALDGFLGNIDKWLKSDSGKKFLKWMETDGPHAIETFGHVMWDVTKAIGRTFDFLYNAGEAWLKHFRQLVHDIARLIDTLRDEFKTGWQGIKNITDNAFHAVESVIRTVMDAVKTTVQGSVNSVKNAVAWFAHLGGLFRGWWDSALHAVRSVADSMVSFVRSIPHRILSALGNLGHLLFAAGEAIVKGLWDGMKSAATGFFHWVSGIGGIISSLKGPLEADAVLLYPHGQAIIGGLMAGMASRMPELTAQLGGIAALIGGTGGPPTIPHHHRKSIPWHPGPRGPHGGPPPIPGGHHGGGGHHHSGGGGGSGGGEVINLTIEVMPGGSGLDMLFASWLRNQVRVIGGGNVQKAYGVPGH